MPERSIDTRRGSAWLDIDDPELDAAWEKLRTEWGDIFQKHNYDVWQYMGTELHDGRGWEHCFRHRCHPSNDKRVYWWCSATEGWWPPLRPMNDNRSAVEVST